MGMTRVYSTKCEKCGCINMSSHQYTGCYSCSNKPNQPERSKREDDNIGVLIEKIIFMRNDLVILEKFPNSSVLEDLLTEILHYLSMRCSEHCGNTVREVQ